MASEVENQLGLIRNMLESIKDASRYEDQVQRRTELDAVMGAEGFWIDPEQANKVIREFKIVKDVVDRIDKLESQLGDTEALLELAIEENDEESLTDATREVRQVHKRAEELELRTLLSGKYDAGNCYLQISPGEGGTESCDWAAMLKRLYLRWMEREGYKVSILDEQPGEEAGIKSFSVHVQGPYGYGYLKAEVGVHRLVRISPFDANSRRQTSFASVHVSPEVEDVEVEVEESDLRIDTYRASGAGGQHVNTTDSAVRITHLPTGIVVQCQNERSQHSNRAAAMKNLAAKLYDHHREQQKDEIESESGEKQKIGFGSQIRNYVLHPYKMVKDRRTGLETGNVDGVLDGDLNPFIEAYLRQSARNS